MIKQLSTTIILGILITFASCSKSDTVSKSQSNSNLLTALLQTQQVQTLQTTVSNLISIQGTYLTYTGTSTATSTTKIVIASTTAGAGDFTSYDSNTTSGNGASIYTIIQFSNTNRILYYQMAGSIPASNYASSYPASYSIIYGRIYWTAPDSTGTFYYCDDYSARQSTLAAVQATTTTVSSTSPGTTGCGGFAWSRAVPTSN